MSETKETFTPDEIIQCIKQWLEFGEKEDKPYFNGFGFAGRCLHFHLEQLMHETDNNEKGCVGIGDHDNLEKIEHNKIEHNYTTGPWNAKHMPKANAYIRSKVYGPKSDLYSPLSIADILETDIGTTEAKANACLIAAAPDLIKAVESAITLLGYFFTEGVTAAWVTDVKKELKAARRKALSGEKP